MGACCLVCVLDCHYDVREPIWWNVANCDSSRHVCRVRWVDAFYTVPIGVELDFYDSVSVRNSVTRCVACYLAHRQEDVVQLRDRSSCIGTDWGDDWECTLDLVLVFLSVSVLESVVVNVQSETFWIWCTVHIDHINHSISIDILEGDKVSWEWRKLITRNKAEWSESTKRLITCTRFELTSRSSCISCRSLLWCWRLITIDFWKIDTFGSFSS